MCVVCASLGGYNSPQWITGYLCVWYVRHWGGGTIVHSGLLDTCVCGKCVTGGYNSPQWITGYLCVWYMCITRGIQ